MTSFKLIIIICLLLALAPDAMAEGKKKGLVFSSLIDSLKENGSKPEASDNLGLKHFSLTCDGKERDYYVHLPPNYSGKTALPLVMAFHGAGGQAQKLPRLTGLSKFADRHSFILVYPEGMHAIWIDGRTGDPGHEMLDVDFVAAMLDKLEKQYKIDVKRVYATGISNGGFFSQYLAIKMPDKIAAVASVAAPMEETMYRQMTPPRPVPIMFMIGDDDPIVSFEGGVLGLGDLHSGRTIAALDAIKFWVKANHAKDPPVTTTIPDAKPNDGTHVIRKVYSAGNNGAEVIFFRIKNGGHTWPSGWQYLPEAIVGVTTKAIDANQEIWTFFQRHHL